MMKPVAASGRSGQMDIRAIGLLSGHCGQQEMQRKIKASGGSIRVSQLD